MRRLFAAIFAAAFIAIAIWSQGGISSPFGPKVIPAAKLGGPIPWAGERPPVPTEGVVDGKKKRFDTK